VAGNLTQRQRPSRVSRTGAGTRPTGSRVRPNPLRMGAGKDLRISKPATQPARPLASGPGSLGVQYRTGACRQWLGSQPQRPPHCARRRPLHATSGPPPSANPRHSHRGRNHTDRQPDDAQDGQVPHALTRRNLRQCPSWAASLEAKRGACVSEAAWGAFANVPRPGSDASRSPGRGTSGMHQTLAGAPQELTTCPLSAILGTRLTNQPGPCACPARVRLPHARVPPARAWPPAGVSLGSRPTTLKPPRRTRPARRGPRTPGGPVNRPVCLSAAHPPAHIAAGTTPTGRLVGPRSTPPGDRPARHRPVPSAQSLPDPASVSQRSAPASFDPPARSGSLRFAPPVSRCPAVSVPLNWQAGTHRRP
jgi:hypothetical protein